MGRKSLGARPLSGEERALLEALSRRGWLRVANPALAFAAFWTVLVSLAPAILRGHVPTAVFPLIVGVGLLLGLPVTVILTADILRRIRDARRDLRTDRIERFAPLDIAAFGSRALLELRQPSGRVLNGPDHMVGHVVEVREVAPAPIVDLRSAQDAAGIPQGRKLERRDLSLEECEEVRRTIREMERVRPSRVLLVVWACVCVWGWIQPEKELTAGDRFAFGASVLVGALVAARELHGRKLARQMRADLANGFAWVLSSQMPDSVQEEQGLPRSHRKWSVAGTPASWRGAALKGARKG